MKKIIISTALILSVSSLSAFSLGDAASAVSAMQTQPTTEKAQTKSSDLTSMLTSQLGVTDKQASGGVGSILSYAKSALPENKYTTLASAIPNSDSLLKMAPSAGNALGALGGSSKNAGLASLASQFSSLGLSTDMISKFVPVIMNYFKDSGKTDAMGILSSLF
jgi:hypothetical protein